MTSGFIDRVRASRLMAAAGLDALVLCAPSAFAYATGGNAGVAALFGRAGACFALVPADPALAIGVVIGDLEQAAFRAASSITDVRPHPLWIETGTLGEGANVATAIEAGWRDRPAGFARPTTFDLGLAAEALRDLFAARHLESARLGLDLAWVPARDRDALQTLLSPARVLDGSDVLDRLMAIKCSEEIRRLRLGAELAMAGLHHMAAGTRLDDDGARLSALFREGVGEAAAARGEPVPPCWHYVGIGPEPWAPGGRVASGTLVKADVGCVVGGYSSDTSRNYVWGEPSTFAADLHGIVEDAHAALLGALKPGVPLAAVHAAATTVLQKAGLHRFSRGHFGHGLGAGPFSEAWPFIAADSDAVAEPGMMLAVEVPIYVSGLGGYNLEDQVLVTDNGIEVISTLPRALGQLGGGAS